MIAICILGYRVQSKHSVKCGPVSRSSGPYVPLASLDDPSAKSKVCGAHWCFILCDKASGLSEELGHEGRLVGKDKKADLYR